MFIELIMLYIVDNDKERWVNERKSEPETIFIQLFEKWIVLSSF